jgi:hypothetical protein
MAELALSPRRRDFSHVLHKTTACQLGDIFISIPILQMGITGNLSDFLNHCGLQNYLILALSIVSILLQVNSLLHLGMFKAVLSMECCFYFYFLC